MFKKGKDNRWEFSIEIREKEMSHTTRTNIENLISLYDIYVLFNRERVFVENFDYMVTLHLKENEQGFAHYQVVQLNEHEEEIEHYTPILSVDKTKLSFRAKKLCHYGIVAWNDPVQEIFEAINTNSPLPNKQTSIEKEVWKGNLSYANNIVYTLLACACVASFGMVVKKARKYHNK